MEQRDNYIQSIMGRIPLNKGQGFNLLVEHLQRLSNEDLRKVNTVTRDYASQLEATAGEGARIIADQMIDCFARHRHDRLPDIGLYLEIECLSSLDNPRSMRPESGSIIHEKNYEGQPLKGDAYSTQ